MTFFPPRPPRPRPGLCGPIRLPEGFANAKTPEELVAWFRANGFEHAHVDYDAPHTTFELGPLTPSPYPLPRSKIFELGFEPLLVPFRPYVPVPPMLIVEPDGTPLHSLKPDGTIWQDGEEYASGDSW